MIGTLFITNSNKLIHGVVVKDKKVFLSLLGRKQSYDANEYTMECVKMILEAHNFSYRFRNTKNIKKEKSK